MARVSDYFITPPDVLAWARDLGRRDLWGLTLMAATGLVIGLKLDDPGAGLFAAGLVLALWWRIDSRWPFGAALVLLVLIPLMQLAYNHNWLFSGASIAAGLAVCVWYLLAIGVIRQVLELRTPEATKALPASAPVAAPPDALVVPAWRQRLQALEREAAQPSTRHLAVDGLRPAGRRRKRSL